MGSSFGINTLSGDGELLDWQNFPLAATWTDQHQRDLSRFLVELRLREQFERAAFEATNVEVAEWTVGGRLWWLIILTAHEEAGGIHARNIHRRLDKGCPSQNDSRCFWTFRAGHGLVWFHGVTCRIS